MDPGLAKDQVGPGGRYERRLKGPMNPTPGWRFAAHWTASSAHGSFTVTVKAEKAAVSADRPLFSPERNNAEATLQGDEMQRSSMRLKGLSQRLRRGRELKWGGAQARVAPLVSACLFVSINTIQSAAKRGRRERRAYSPSGLVAYAVNAGLRRREFGDVFQNDAWNVAQCGEEPWAALC